MEKTKKNEVFYMGHSDMRDFRHATGRALDEYRREMK